jgi:hypothetical protein
LVAGAAASSEIRAAEPQAKLADNIVSARSPAVGRHQSSSLIGSPVLASVPRPQG